MTFLYCKTLIKYVYPENMPVLQLGFIQTKISENAATFNPPMLINPNLKPV